MTPPSHAAPERVLIVEDDPGLRQLLAEEVREHDLDVMSAASAGETRSLLHTWEPDVVASDLRLPDASALQLLQEVRSMHVPPAFVVITAFGTIAEAVQALKAGADDFLTKPLDLDHFMLSLSRALETRRLKQEVRRFREVLGYDRFHGMLGRSRPMRIVIDYIKQVALARGPVLIAGESGVGKELVAHAIHRESPRAAQPFLAINCVAIPDHLMESELFGHMAGAFTGATHGRKGLFVEAHGGTLLLDEIAEMPLALQGKLLRVLEDGQVRPLGSNRAQQVDVRILASTNRDVKTEVEEGRFREDLDPGDAARLRDAGEALANALSRLPGCEDMDVVRGIEGESARAYFRAIDKMVREDRNNFRLDGRNRRPPTDPMNALLSFLYALLLNDCVAAAQGVGLDPQVGFLHALKPGRPALGLDLMEELRSVLADRLVLTLVNRKQIAAKHFVTRSGGAVYLHEDARKEVIVAYQKRKQEEITHPVLEQKMAMGLIPHVQARLLARVLRGDLEAYPPYLYR